MVQGYFTLQEAAEFLHIGADELKQIAQRKEIRSFQDRGTLRFRVQDVHELGRQRGAGSSDPDLMLHDPLPATPKPAPKSPRPAAPKSPNLTGPKTPAGPRTPTKEPTTGDDIFDFSLDVDDSVDIGREILTGSSKKLTPSAKSPVRSPQPPPGSDSDVKLVNTGNKEGSDSDVRLSGRDSDVKMEDATAKTPKVSRNPAVAAGSPTPKKSSRLASPQPDSAPSKPPSRATGAAQPADSGVRLVPMDSDSDVKIVGAGSDEITLGATPPQSATDSDIRLEKYAQLPADSGEGVMPLTEEINLDEEIRKQESTLRQPQAKVKRKSKLKLPTSSPFELSESDAGVKEQKSGPKPVSVPDSSDFELAPATPKDDSSDFDLGAASDGSGSVLLQPDGSDDFSLELSEESALAAEPSNLAAPSSGISLNNPVDAGISLEDGSAADSDYDLSLDVESTPKPAPVGAGGDSEFELTLDADDSGPQSAVPSPADSDSEFELTLDDSGGVSLEEDSPAKSGEKDIFETDFEVPALEDDSGSQVAPLDTDLDSSDFDIALDDSAVESESASEVVALDEDAVQVDTEGQEFGELEAAQAEDEVAEVADDVDDAKTVVREKLVQPAPWGALPVAFMLPCVIVMVLVGLLGFELVQSAGGYKAPGYLTKAIADMIGKPIK